MEADCNKKFNNTIWFIFYIIRIYLLEMSVTYINDHFYDLIYIK